MASFLRSLERTPCANAKEARSILARLALRFSEEDEKEQDQVILSSLHGSKGLEFSLVFLVGCDDGIIPHGRVDNPKATDIVGTLDPSEERRLFYVGVTRAKDRLYMLRTKMRLYRGSTRVMAASRFFRDIPEDLIERRAYSGRPVLATSDLAAKARATRELLAKLKAGTPPTR